MNGITRQKQGKSFVYHDSSGPLKDEALIERINALAIPPAWQEVSIARSPKAKILASGRDAAGRKQAIYNPVFRARQEQLKFDRILRFAQALPSLRRQIDKDLKRRRLGKEKVLACIVKLIDEAYFRVGNERYAHQNNSYGITTLRHKHTDITGDTVTFDFVGKSGKEHVKRINDRQVARIVKQLDELPGYEIFCYLDAKGNTHNIDSRDVNEYIKTYMGEEFSAKDFRTWGGTLLATTELVAAERCDTAAARKKLVSSVVKNVAKRLGNTPAVARSSYIDPRIIAAYTDSDAVEKLQKTIAKMKPRKYMSRDEQCVMHLLG